MQTVKNLLNEIKVYDCNLTKIRIGNNCDGGYVAAKELCEKTDTVYSFGIGDDISFELHYINMFPNSKKIKLFDHTVDELPITHPKFSFHKQGIGNGYGTPENIFENSLLKMDVEYCEWEAFELFDNNSLKKFSQILVEFHIVHAEMRDHLTPYFQNFYEHALSQINSNLFIKYYHVIKKLNELFYIYHIHANNSLPKISVGGYDFPPLIELSLVRKDLVSDVHETETNFPIDSLDFPNKTDRADIACVYPLGA